MNKNCKHCFGGFSTNYPNKVYCCSKCRENASANRNKQYFINYYKSKDKCRNNLCLSKNCTNIIKNKRADALYCSKKCAKYEYYLRKKIKK